MSVDALPVLAGVWRDQRRSLMLWALALAIVSAVYVAFYPSMGAGKNGAMQSLLDQMPKGLVEAMGYDRIGTAGGWLTSTVYGLLGPALLLVFTIGTGARLIAGQEEDGSLELELAAPVTRDRVYCERLLALWLDILLLIAGMTLVTWILVRALDMQVGADRMVAGSTGLALLVLGFGTLSLATGAATGRRAVALGVGSALAVLAYVFNAIGPQIDAAWMTDVSPFSWFLEGNPLVEGFDARGLLLLAAVPLVAGPLGLLGFRRRDLMV